MTDAEPGFDPASAVRPAELASLAFDRMDSAAAIVDEHGTIEAVNEAWRLVAHRNDGHLAAADVGVSYLDVCSRAAAAGNLVAGEVAEGLRQIVNGERQRFDREYRCSSLAGDDWFELRASRATGEATHIVVLHVDITAQKRLRDLDGEPGPRPVPSRRQWRPWRLRRRPRGAPAEVLIDLRTAEGPTRRDDATLLRARRAPVVRVPDDTMQVAFTREARVGELIDRVLAAGAVGVGYQPIGRLSDQTTVGAEALLRVVDDEGTPVSPLALVEPAERGGRIAELGELILRTACTDAASWPRAGSGRPVTVSVNLSARQLDDPSLPRRVESALDASGLPPSSLCLEVTEGALMADPSGAARQMGILRARGVRFAADDFGTGYSSLSYLKALPLDALKIDQSFVAGLPESLEDVAITQAVLAMSDALGLEVTAEGIETQEQLGALLELGTDLGQGYLWGRAMSTVAFTARLENEACAPAPAAPVVARARWRIRPPAPLGASEERIDSILGILAHEIRAPLGMVVGYARALEGTSDPTEADAAAAIGRAALRITRILSSIVDVSVASDGARTGDLEVVDAAAAVRELLDDSLLGGRVTLRAPDGAPGPILIEVNADQLAQVVTNLLSNADRFSPAGSPIDVAVTGAGGWVDISVTDRGSGIASDDLGLVFRKYGRTDPFARGTGLGLYLARQVARSHGGDVLYRRGEQAGSVFVLRLPLAAP